MRWHFLLLGIFAGLEVLALDAAAPWEMMYFYAAYKAEWLAGLTGSQRQIATLCKRSTNHPFAGSDFDAQAAAAGVTGMCSFDDFVKFVGVEKPFANYIYTLEGSMWDIDQYWNQIMKKFDLYKMPGGKANRYAYDLQKLLPKGGFGAGTNAFPPAIKQGANALQAAREAAPGVGVVEGQAQYAAEYTRIAQQVRNKDGAPYAGQTVREYFGTLTTNPFTLQFKPQTLISPPAPSTAGNIGAYNNELDFDATLSLNADGTRNPSTGPQRNAFKAYFAVEYADTDEVRDHNNVIQAFHEVIDYIWRNRAGCRLAAVAPAAKRDLLYLENRDLLMDVSIMGNTFQSHLVPMDVKFKKMDVVIPEQPFDHLMRMRAVSV